MTQTEMADLANQIAEESKQLTDLICHIKKEQAEARCRIKDLAMKLSALTKAIGGDEA